MNTHSISVVENYINLSVDLSSPIRIIVNANF